MVERNDIDDSKEVLLLEIVANIILHDILWNYKIHWTTTW